MNRDAAASEAPRADVGEVFSGIQGEGVHLGRRQIFVRFAGCNLRCRYCDTASAWTASPLCRVERRAGQREFIDLRNPLSPQALLGVVKALHVPRSLHHAVALTGGEPLLHASFLGALLEGIRAAGLRVFLETNGTLPDALASVIESVDIVSMDIKLASATGQPARLEENHRFLDIACRSEAYVKVVVGVETTVAEIAAVARLVAERHDDVPLILQPVTPAAGEQGTTPAQILRLQEAAAELLPDVRVIPQAHKLIGQM